MHAERADKDRSDAKETPVAEVLVFHSISGQERIPDLTVGCGALQRRQEMSAAWKDLYETTAGRAP